MRAITVFYICVYFAYAEAHLESSQTSTIKLSAIVKGKKRYL